LVFIFFGVFTTLNRIDNICARYSLMLGFSYDPVMPINTAFVFFTFWIARYLILDLRIVEGMFVRKTPHETIPNDANGARKKLYPRNSNKYFCSKCNN